MLQSKLISYNTTRFLEPWTIYSTT